MGFNVVCSAILVLLGSPLRIYIISNGGYLLSCSLALAGYFVVPAAAPGRAAAVPAADLRCKWIALAVFVVWMVIYFFGGWNSPKIVLADPHQGPGLYLLGSADRRPVRAAVLVAGLAGPQAGGVRRPGPLRWPRSPPRRGILGTPGNTVTEAEPSAGEPPAVR